MGKHGRYQGPSVDRNGNDGGYAKHDGPTDGRADDDSVPPHGEYWVPLLLPPAGVPCFQILQMVVTRSVFCTLCRPARLLKRMSSTAAPAGSCAAGAAGAVAGGRLPTPSPQYAAAGLDVWTMMNQAAASVDAVNLGQGYMSFAPRSFITRAAQAALTENAHNQYAPPRGRPALLAQVAARFSRLLSRNIDPASEVSVHTGANEALLSAFTAFLEHGKGQEVILIEPAFDQYTPNVIMAGGRPVYVPLRVCTDKDPAKEVISSGDWKLDPAELEAAIGSKTRVLVLNTPHNPVGKVFTRGELEGIAAVAKRHNLLVIADEVYEHLTYGMDHVSIAALPGMWERTITVGSAGKLFGVTGWRVGWAVGPAALIGPTLSAHTRIVFTSNTPLQEGIASALSLAGSHDFFNVQRAEYERRRNRLMAALDDAGLPYVVPEGAYYLLANAASIKIPADYEFPPYITERGDNFKLVYYFIREFGVSGIPPTEFYSEAHKDLAKDYIRFAFCKTDEGLEEAARRLQKVKIHLRGSV